ncbi:MAG: CBS domain-containing protein [Candidatus Omnitrophica bacterium]|nr:CBS domain-containing protein [Candidatus Omnitrophota bacterium]
MRKKILLIFLFSLVIPLFFVSTPIYGEQVLMPETYKSMVFADEGEKRLFDRVIKWQLLGFAIACVGLYLLLRIISAFTIKSRILHLLVNDIMQKEPVTVEPNYSLQEAKNTMFTKNLHTLPVTTGIRELKGIITRRDIEQFQENNIADALRYHDIEEVMTKNLMTLSIYDRMTRAIELILKNDFDCVPVVDIDRRILGIITRKSLLEAFVKYIFKTL